MEILSNAIRSSQHTPEKITLPIAQDIDTDVLRKAAEVAIYGMDINIFVRVPKGKTSGTTTFGERGEDLTPS